MRRGLVNLPIVVGLTAFGLGCEAPLTESPGETTGSSSDTGSMSADAAPGPTTTAAAGSSTSSTTTSGTTTSSTITSATTGGGTTSSRDDASSSSGSGWTTEHAGDSTTAGASTGPDRTETTSSSTSTTAGTGFETTSSSGTTTGGTETEAGSSSSSTGPPLMLPDPLPQSDEFDDVDTLDTLWQRRHIVEGTPPQYTTLDIDSTRPGYLTLVPTTSGWYNDFDGPLIYTTLTGDFMVEVEVEALNIDDGGGPPTQFFNSAGIMIRDPNHGPGIERWVTHNVGYQDDQVGTERKITFFSASTLVITPSVHTGRLRMCRVGNEIVLTRRMADESAFTEINTYEVMTFPDEVQVGLNVTAWNSLSAMPNTDEDPDLLAQWNYIRFYPATETELCFVNDP